MTQHFETLDFKKECAVFYLEDGRIVSAIPDHARRTWKPYAALQNLKDLEYAWLYVNGAEPDLYLPESLKKIWQRNVAKTEIQLKALRKARVPLEGLCIYDVLPLDLILEKLDCMIEVDRHVFEVCEKPANHDFLASLYWVIQSILQSKLNLSVKDVNPAEISLQKIKSLLKFQHLSYTMFGSKTGRLGLEEGSFPLMNLAKPYRALIKPNNDLFVEFDQNAADLRALLGLMGKEQPEEDLHTWNVRNIFRNQITRDEAKKEIFAWLYGYGEETKLGQYYDKKEILSVVYENECVQTPFGRKVKADPEYALSYAAQSTAADVFYDRVIAIHDYLRERKAKTKIVFLMHDAVVLDYASEDGVEIMTECQRLFSDTIFGQYRIGTSVGNDYYNMRQI